VCVLCQIHFTKGEALFSMFAFSRLYPHANFTLTNLDRLEEDKFLAVYPGERQFTLESEKRGM